MDELLMERYALAKERVCEIKEEKAVQMPYLDFFQKTAAFLEKNVEIMDGVVFLGETREPRKLADAADLSIDEWKELNRDLYADILPENYKNSYGNPVYACEKLGEYGKDFSFLYAELRGIVVYAFENEAVGHNCASGAVSGSLWRFCSGRDSYRRRIEGDFKFLCK